MEGSIPPPWHAHHAPQAIIHAHFPLPLARLVEIERDNQKYIIYINMFSKNLSIFSAILISTHRPVVVLPKHKNQHAPRSFAMTMALLFLLTTNDDVG
jgi:hypothetical protein